MICNICHQEVLDWGAPQHTIDCQGQHIKKLEAENAEMRQQLEPDFSPELKPLLEFDVLQQSWDNLIEILDDLWKHEYGWMKTLESNEEGHREIYLATGGWSENEEIILAIQQNHVLWTITWQKCRHGGAYWFDDSRWPKHREKH